MTGAAERSRTTTVFVPPPEDRRFFAMGLPRLSGNVRKNTENAEKHSAKPSGKYPCPEAARLRTGHFGPQTRAELTAILFSIDPPAVSGLP